PSVPAPQVVYFRWVRRGQGAGLADFWRLPGGCRHHSNRVDELAEDLSGLALPVDETRVRMSRQPVDRLQVLIHRRRMELDHFRWLRGPLKGRPQVVEAFIASMNEAVDFRRADEKRARRDRGIREDGPGDPRTGCC